MSEEEKQPSAENENPQKPEGTKEPKAPETAATSDGTEKPEGGDSTPAAETAGEPAGEEATEPAAPGIQIPQTPAPSSEDIVASKPDREERQSAVIGKVDRPQAEPKDPRRGRARKRAARERRVEEEESGLFEKVVHINRCAKVVSGGRRFSFAALVVVGDQQGQVGVGYGKAKEVPECIRKGTEQARKNMRPVAMRNNTIPHVVTGEHDGGRILLRPAVPGTGVIAGGGVRAVLEAAGVKDVLSKSLRSNNPGAMVFATLDALKQLRTAETIRKLRKAEGE